MNQPVESIQVSCIIPVYNAEQFLAETIESVLAQTHAVDEILFVDDGSIDTTKTIIDSYVEKHPTQIRYVRQERGGPGAARNRGILAARGEFISFLDGDDLWHKEKTARQLHRFMERPELGISVTHIQNFWLDNLHNREAGIQEHSRAKAMAGYVPPAAMVRRAIFERVGLFNVNLR